ncbi:MAG: Fe-S cluster assembly protein SufB, partial [Gaiellales bacterium]
MSSEVADVDLGEYKYGFHDEENPVIKIERGLNEDVIRQISAHKGEPEWMLDFRLEAYKIFLSKPMPNWGSDLSGIDFENIFYYLKPAEHNARSWDDVPETIKNTFERLGIPEAERKFLAGVGAQYESEVIYHSLKKELEDQGILFLDTDQALLQHEDLFREYFGTIIPSADNKFSALNSAVWSGGSFIYVPPGVRIEQPLQAYFRINAENMGQFERTLIIVDEGAYVHYVEGCTAPTYSSDSLHSAVVEILVKKGGRCRYTTIQN